MTTEGGWWYVKMDWSDLSLSSIDASAQVSVALHAGPTGIKGDRSPPLMVPHPFSGSCPGFEIRIFRPQDRITFDIQTGCCLDMVGRSLLGGAIERFGIQPSQGVTANITSQP